jgi:hypothetical protein
MVNLGEEWDDGNAFAFDGWDTDWVNEPGFICTGGSSTSPVSWIENEFMPSWELSVDISNNIYLDFNDTLYENVIVEDGDIEIRVYGPESQYTFTWTGKFTGPKSYSITTSFVTGLSGDNQESVILNFINTDKFKSVFSNRGVNPEELSGYLYKSSGSGSSSESLGQSAMYIFVASILLALISSFGGNSMEMMWNMMNSLQMMYFLSYVYVQFPDYVETFFSFLDYANLDNQYTRFLTSKIISNDNFKRGDLNDRIGAKAFYVSSADKVPLLIILVVMFVLTIIVDMLKIKDKNKWVDFTVRMFEHLKYNFFIRFGTEVFLELVINSSVNIYWVSFIFTLTVI